MYRDGCSSRGQVPVSFVSKSRSRKVHLPPVDESSESEPLPFVPSLPHSIPRSIHLQINSRSVLVIRCPSACMCHSSLGPVPSVPKCAVGRGYRKTAGRTLHRIMSVCFIMSTCRITKTAYYKSILLMYAHVLLYSVYICIAYYTFYGPSPVGCK